MDFKIAGDIAGKIKTEAAGSAVAGVGHQVDIGIEVEKIEFGRQIDIVSSAEILIHILPNRQKRRSQGDILQISREAFDPLGLGNDKAFQGLFRIVGILGSIDKTDRIPGIALAPFIGFFTEAGVDLRGRSNAHVSFIEFGTVARPEIILTC